MTNVVEVVREVVVTNTVTVTNAVGPAQPALSARRTAPYLVFGRSLDDVRMRRFLSSGGARVIECDPGAVALVEAPEKVINVLRAANVATVLPLRVEDKVGTDVGEKVRVVPLSSIDLQSVADAVRALGGEVVEVRSVGLPAVRARLPRAAIRNLAVRGDVRKIERDGE